MAKLTKLDVSNGIFWVEVPDAGMAILCGCPADAVKHLIRRGLIVSEERGGSVCETGPNAILLSDVMLQRGAFANLAEFPVLQMLYKQGMILPNHPNNTGIKPLLIGTNEQVHAQLAYIFRGNYGLISSEEIQAAGIDAETAQRMMRLKLKFAFGRIVASDQLLDGLVVAEGEQEIRNGLFIQRIRSNVYEFRYEEERLTVDLNLKPRQSYEPAYPLGYQIVSREYFGVIHSGEGDGWDVNRPTMASILMFQGNIYLIDPGPNLLHSLMALGIGISEIKGIFHTHSHDDHFAGITTLMRAGHRLKYYSTALVRLSVQKKLAVLLSIEENSFFDFFDVCDLKFDHWNDIDSLEVRPFFSPHPVETNCFFFRTLWEDGYRTYAHLADTVSLDILEKMVEDSDEPGAIHRAFFERVKEEYLTPVDLKKIDVGGGPVHGVAEDFREDASGKIVLAHTSQPLTDEEKEIGSNASFGVIDVLIPRRHDFLREHAFVFFSAYFPHAPRTEILVLLNGEILTFSPGTIILKEKEINRDIFMVLTGSVFMLHASQGINSLLSAGAFLGELSGLYQQHVGVTFRTSGFVQALRIPSALYLEFIKKNDLYAKVEELHERRHIILTTAIFGEGLSYQVQNRMAQQMTPISLAPKEKFQKKNSPDLFLVSEGSLLRLDQEAPVLIKGDYLGEESAMFNLPSRIHVQAVEDTKLFRIPGEILRDIPIVRWKLFEALQMRDWALGV